MVRATAVRALGLVADSRGAMPLVARLNDPARVVRVRAAEALLSLGIVRLPGAAGEVLAKAQDEYAASLQTFPDRAEDHAALGWLEMERGRSRGRLRRSSGPCRSTRRSRVRRCCWGLPTPEPGATTRRSIGGGR